jgi:hypothetical protein
MDARAAGKALIPLALSLAALASLIALYVGGHPFQSALVNSDAFYLPTLFDDLFAGGGRLRDWYLTPAPYFFPDFVLYLPAYLLGADTYQQVLLFALLQLGLIGVAILFIARNALPGNRSAAAALAFVILVWLAVNGEPPLSLLAVSAHHGGAFLALLAALALWLRIDADDCSRATLRMRLALCLLTLSTVLSDALFVVQAIVPLVGAALLCRGDGRIVNVARRLALPVLVASLLGFKAYKRVVAKPMRYDTHFGLGHLKQNVHALRGMFDPVFSSAPLLGVAVVAFAAFGLVCLLRCIAGRPAWLPRALHLLVVFSTLSMAGAVLSLAFSLDLTLAPRYLMPVFALPVIVGSLLLAHWLGKRFAAPGQVAAALCSASLAVAGWHAMAARAGAARFYGPDLACIDDALADPSLRNGIAQYWDAKRIQAVSRRHLTLAQYESDLAEMRWITSERFFQPSYDFAIVDDREKPEFTLPRDRLAAINGEPARSVRCGDRTVLIYGHGKLRVTNPSSGATARN